MTDVRTKMQALARTFHSLEHAPIDPWDAEALDAWGAGPAASTGARHAVRFLLLVWNNTNGDPARRVVDDLSSELERVLSQTMDLAERKMDEGPMMARRVRNAEEHAIKAVRLYKSGNPEALEAAKRAAEICDAFTRLDAWLSQAHVRAMKEIDVLRVVAEAVVWRVGTFDLASALATWDDRNQSAFLEWVKRPWFA